MMQASWKLVADQKSMPRRVYSIAMINEFASNRYELSKRITTVGRDASCSDIALPGHHVSRAHAELVIEDGAVILRDLNSANGTYVNGSPIKELALQPGDRISFDTITLTLFSPDEDPDATVLYQQDAQIGEERTYYRDEQSVVQGSDGEDGSKHSVYKDRRHQSDRRESGHRWPVGIEVLELPKSRGIVALLAMTALFGIAVTIWLRLSG